MSRVVMRRIGSIQTDRSMQGPLHPAKLWWTMTGQNQSISSGTETTSGTNEMRVYWPEGAPPYPASYRDLDLQARTGLWGIPIALVLGAGLGFYLGRRKRR